MQLINTSNKTCISCNQKFDGEFLYLGKLPPSNQFHKNIEKKTDTIPLYIHQCRLCSLIQLVELPDITILQPKVPWIQYNEPDSHLIDLVDILKKNFLKKNDLIYSISPFDAPLLVMLEQNGMRYKHIELLNIFRNKQKKTFPYLETLQSYLKIEIFKKILQREELATAVTCRYLLEHCHNPIQALISLRYIINENGIIIIEVPDSTKFLKRKDYSFIWEEHVCYFTKKSLKNMFRESGYQLLDLLKYTGNLEDALVAIIKPGKKNISNRRSFLYEDKSVFKDYLNSFNLIKNKYHTLFNSITKSQKRIIMFGAGHQAISFINIFDVSRYISFIVDDNPYKQNHFLPGSGIPIVNSSVFFTEKEICLCLLSVNPTKENHIKKKFSYFIKQGGKFYSIFSNQILTDLKGRNVWN